MWTTIASYMFLVEIGILFFRIHGLKNVGNYHVKLIGDTTTPEITPLASFHHGRLAHLKYCVQFDLL